MAHMRLDDWSAGDSAGVLNTTDHFPAYELATKHLLHKMVGAALNGP